MLNFIKSNNLKAFIANILYLCTMNQNIEIMKRNLPLGEYRDIIPSCGGSDAPYFADMIIDLKEFDATHYPDGRAKSKAVTMW